MPPVRRPVVARLIDPASAGVHPGWIRLFDLRSRWMVLTAFRAYALGRAPGVVIALVEIEASPRNPVGTDWLACFNDAYKDAAGKLAGCFATAHLPIVWFGRAPPAWLRAITLGLPVQSTASPLPEEAPVRGSRGSTAELPPFIGIIDDGCAFANEQFLMRRGDVFSSRVVALWDQDNQWRRRVRDEDSARQAAAPWNRPASFVYGRDLSARRSGAHLVTEIDAILAQNTHRGLLDEDGCYRQAAYGLERSVQCHGTGVMDIAAGRGRTAMGWRITAQSEDRRVVFVQLPSLTVEDSSGTSLGPHVLDGICYIHQTVRRLGGEAVAINLSFGALAGPHDGSTLAERAIDDYLGRHPDVALVMSAGNGRLRGAHARCVITSLKEGCLHWNLSPLDMTPSLLELWFASDDVKAPAFEIDLLVTPPSGEPLEPICLSTSGAPLSFVLEHGGQPIGWLFVDPAGASRAGHGAPGGEASRKGVSVLLALPASHRPYRDGSDTLRTLPGRWIVQARLRKRSPAVVLDAYIERDDAQFHGGLGNLSFFDEDQVTQEGTLGSMTTGVMPIVVGACVHETLQALPDSAAGPSRRMDAQRPGPDLLAVGALARELPGVPVTTFRGGGQWLMSGTSAAAPAVTTRVAGLLHARARLPDRPPVDGTPMPTTREWVLEALRTNGDLVAGLGDEALAQRGIGAMKDRRHGRP